MNGKELLYNIKFNFIDLFLYFAKRRKVFAMICQYEANGKVDFNLQLFDCDSPTGEYNLWFPETYYCIKRKNGFLILLKSFFLDILGVLIDKFHAFIMFWSLIFFYWMKFNFYYPMFLEHIRNPLYLLNIEKLALWLSSGNLNATWFILFFSINLGNLIFWSIIISIIAMMVFINREPNPDTNSKRYEYLITGISGVIAAIAGADIVNVDIFAIYFPLALLLYNLIKRSYDTSLVLIFSYFLMYSLSFAMINLNPLIFIGHLLFKIDPKLSFYADLSAFNWFFLYFLFYPISHLFLRKQNFRSDLGNFFKNIENIANFEIVNLNNVKGSNCLIQLNERNIFNSEYYLKSNLSQYAKFINYFNELKIFENQDQITSIKLDIIFNANSNENFQKLIMERANLLFKQLNTNVSELYLCFNNCLENIEDLFMEVARYWHEANVNQLLIYYKFNRGPINEDDDVSTYRYFQYLDENDMPSAIRNLSIQPLPDHLVYDTSLSQLTEIDHNANKVGLSNSN